MGDLKQRFEAFLRDLISISKYDSVVQDTNYTKLIWMGTPDDEKEEVLAKFQTAVDEVKQERREQRLLSRSQAPVLRRSERLRAKRRLVEDRTGVHEDP